MRIAVSADLSQWDGDVLLMAGSVRVAAVAAVLGVGAAACSSNPTARLPRRRPTPTLAPSTTTRPHLDSPHHRAWPCAHDDGATGSTAGAATERREDAANALVGYWASGNGPLPCAWQPLLQSRPCSVWPIPTGWPINRGCSSSFSPIVCTYGAPAGGPVNAPIYQLDEVQAPSGGWYVNTVQIES